MCACVLFSDIFEVTEKELIFERTLPEEKLNWGTHTRLCGTEVLLLYPLVASRWHCKKKNAYSLAVDWPTVELVCALRVIEQRVAGGKCFGRKEERNKLTV